MTLLRWRRFRGPGLARLPLIAALVALAGVAACDSGTDPGGDLPDIEGTWEAASGGFTQYFEITATTLTEHWGVEGQCFISNSFTIVNRDGETVTLSSPGGGGSFSVILRREGSGLRLVDPATQQSVLFSASTADVSQLTECGPGAGGSDPALTCSTLPAITLGQPINGSLEASDPTWLGSHYDLYGLTLDAQQQVTISQTSGQIDSYLYLYEFDGTYIDEDDDSGGGFDSSLTVTLDAGCYRIETTSWAPGETGAYTLSVN